MAINFPSNPQIGDTITQGNRTWQWSGEFWRSISTTIGYSGSQGDVGYTGSQGDQGDIGYTGSGTGYLVSNTAPESAQVGDRWYDADSGIEFTYIFDGDDFFWVEVGTVSSGAGLAGNVSIGTDSNSTVTFNAKVASDIVPAANITYDLGSNDNRWKDLYLSGNTIYLGSALISANESGALVLPANTKIGGNEAGLPASGAFSFRNKLINGNFDIWQRATSQTSSGYGSADRWSCVNNGSTKTASRQAFALGQTDVPNNPKYFMRHVVTSVAGASNFVAFLQKIEGVETLAGQTATISFWAKADASKNIAVEFEQIFGSGGSPSAAISDIGSQLVALTTSWTKYTITVAIPSVSGKTLGTDGNDCIQFIFWFDAGSTYDSRTASLGQQSGTFDIAQVQIEEGSAATPFEQRPIGTEFSLCERYYQVVPLNAFDATVTTYSAPYYFSTPMRTTPSGTISGGSSLSVSTRGLENVTNKGGRFTIIGSAGNSYSVGASGLFDAEL